jgi:hypothetical protein
MRTIGKFIAGLVLLLFAGCATAPATTVSLPKKRADECRKHCKTLDMELGAVVIVMNSAGCVCEPKRPPAANAQPNQRGNAAAVAGGAAIKATIEAQKQKTAPPPESQMAQPQ